MHTLLTYLGLYKEFSDEDQMKRVVSLLHRIAVKATTPQLFYKVRHTARLMQDSAFYTRKLSCDIPGNNTRSFQASMGR